MIFRELTGDDLGVYNDENYRLIQCVDGHIVFSYARKGNAMTIHIASDKQGLREIKPAINAFCEWLFNLYAWCELIFAAIARELKSMIRIVKKCRFEYLIDDSKHSIYARYRT